MYFIFSLFWLDSQVVYVAILATYPPMVHWTKVASDTLYLFAGHFKKGSSAVKFYPYFYLECIIKINNFVFVHSKSSYQQNTLAAKAKWHLKAKINKIQKMLCICQLLVRRYFQMTSKCTKWLFSQELSRFFRQHDHFRFTKWLPISIYMKILWLYIDNSFYKLWNHIPRRLINHRL